MNNCAKIAQHEKVYKTILNQSPFLEAGCKRFSEQKAGALAAGGSPKGQPAGTMSMHWLINVYICTYVDMHPKIIYVRMYVHVYAHVQNDITIGMLGMYMYIMHRFVMSI